MYVSDKYNSVTPQ